MNNLEFLNDLMKVILIHKGKIAGGIIGFIFGILFLVIGFLKTVLIIICTVIGCYIGSTWDTDRDLRRLIDKILPPQLK